MLYSGYIFFQTPNNTIDFIYKYEDDNIIAIPSKRLNLTGVSSNGQNLIHSNANRSFGSESTFINDNLSSSKTIPGAPSDRVSWASVPSNDYQYLVSVCSTPIGGIIRVYISKKTNDVWSVIHEYDLPSNYVYSNNAQIKWSLDDSEFVLGFTSIRTTETTDNYSEIYRFDRVGDVFTYKKIYTFQSAMVEINISPDKKTIALSGLSNRNTSKPGEAKFVVLYRPNTNVDTTYVNSNIVINAGSADVSYIGNFLNNDNIYLFSRSTNIVSCRLITRSGNIWSINLSATIPTYLTTSGLMKATFYADNNYIIRNFTGRSEIGVIENNVMRRIHNISATCPLVRIIELTHP